MSKERLPAALDRMEAFAVSHESTPEEALDIRLIAAAVADYKAALDALWVESGGEAIPNDNLTIARRQALVVMARWA